MLAGRCLPSGGLVLYGPWFPKPETADHFVIALSIMVAGGATVKVDVETKTKLENDSDATPKSGISAQSAKGVYRAMVENLLELVRYKYTTGGSGTVHFEMACPGWLGSH